MMLWQGALAYKLFTGEDMPVDQVKQILLKMTVSKIKRQRAKMMIILALCFIFSVI